MIRKTTIILFLVFGTWLSAVAQTITVKPVEEGTYGAGSSVAVPITIADPDGRFQIDNIFKLYISDATGSFALEKEIGTYTGFYATFINGTLPADLAPGNYKLRVKSVSPFIVSGQAVSVKVGAKNNLQVEIDAAATQVISTKPKTFGICSPERAANFKFTNTSSAGAAVTATFVNEMHPEDVQNFALDAPLTFAAGLTHYTIYVKASRDGLINTKAYFLINNSVKQGFNPPPNNTVCLPAKLIYNIETLSANGIQNNFPGYTYQVNWGDDVTENFTPNQIIASSAKIAHTYNRSSCGKQIKINDVTFYNVFGIIYQVKSPFCGLISVPLSTLAKVVTKPENRFSLPASVCLNTNFSVTNSSIAGDNPSANAPSCTNNSVVYYWFADGQPITPQGVPISYKPTIKFATPGMHTVRLESESNSNCPADPLEVTCYVQPAPVPNFTLSETTVCAGSTVKAADLSVTDKDPKAQNTYLWSVKGPAAAPFANGTNSASANPEFKFTATGIYTIQLAITSPCGKLTAEQTVVVNEKPVIVANWQANSCGKGQLLKFNATTGNPVFTNLTGTAKAENDTYNWTITGGDFVFTNNTASYSKEPEILFQSYGTYTITIAQQNNCGSATVTKTITFNESPTINAGADQTVCSGSIVSLNGTVSNGTAKSVAWTGGMGKFSPSRDVLDPTYLPTSEELAKGEVQLTLVITTTNPVPCTTVEDQVLIKIAQANKITSPPAKAICTNNTVDYQPQAVLEGSTINWIAQGSDNASGWKSSGTGKIADRLVNSDPTRDATVVYTIIPSKNGCEGAPFTLTVTVTATPVVTAIAPGEAICSGREARIVLNSNLPGMRYTWTSEASEKITGNRQQITPVALDELKDVLTNAGSETGSVTYTITPENVTGCSGAPIKVTVSVFATPGLSTFAPNKTTGCSPLAVTFNNTTVGAVNAYHWDFGDGHTSTTTGNAPVLHTYNSAVTRTFTARLVTETNCGSFSSEYIIRVTPSTVQPELVVNGNEYEGCAPHTVTFFNNSKGALRFTYDFGDGQIIETNRSPENITHTFAKGGTYVVKLTASNGCSDTTTTETIRVYPQPVPAFEASATQGCRTLTVKFTNKSEGALTYKWDFGDGTISTEANPIHTFSSAKPAYTVTLIATSSLGCTDTLVREEYIRITAPPTVAFQVLPGETIQYPNYHFSFKNKSTGAIASYSWDFGDGELSNQQNAEHTYADTGAYKVSLKIVSETGCADILTKTVRITGTPGNLYVPNAFMPNSATEELRTFRVKGRGIGKFEMRVFNKWGEMIWETTNLDEKGAPVDSWDGTMHGVAAPQGIYFWQITAKFKNGNEWPGMAYGSGEPKRIGTINLIR